MQFECEGAPTIEGDTKAVSRVVTNLVTNAVEAIADRGTITVSVGTGGARHVWLEVGDDGCGMDERTRTKMFNPFFTSKEIGRGLGLAMVQGIVRAHEGSIEVQSDVGAGSRIRCLFPASASPLIQTADRPDVTRPARGGLVLVVEDERMLRKALRHLLKRAGFEVILAKDGLEALDLFRPNTRTSASCSWT